MNTATFLEKFDLIAEIPNAVEKMRELVIQLAVRGKISTQIKNESCKDQLKKIWENLSSRKKIKEFESWDRDPFEIPKNWAWLKIGETMQMFNGKAFKPEEWSKEGIPIIRIQNLNNENASFNYCNLEVDKKIHVNKGDFLISWSGTPGTSFGAFIWRRQFGYLNQHIFKCEVNEDAFVKEFLKLAVNSRLDKMISQAQGAVGLRHITKGKLESINIPLPPLEEQKRIVARVDELMAICDQLEAKQKERDEKHKALCRSALARFSEDPTPANLEYLFHPSFKIPPDDLRKTILSLAVQGKLVEQDPEDEPAEITFPEIAKAAICKNDFNLPINWFAVPLGNIGEWRGGGTPSKSKPNYWNGEIPWVSPKDMKVLHISDAQDHISELAVEESSVKLIPQGSLLMVVRGMILGRAFPVALTKNVVTINQDMKSLIPFYKNISEFLLIALQGIESQVLNAIEHSTHGTCKLETDVLHSFVVFIPPLNEQKRILNKINELLEMTSCIDADETLLIKLGELTTKSIAVRR